MKQLNLLNLIFSVANNDLVTRAIDEYKEGTGAGKFQLLIANAETKESIDTLPNRRKDTIKRYFSRYGWNVEIVILDMSSSFRVAIEEAIERRR